MITDDELEAIANSVGCEVTYMGDDLWECYHRDGDYCSYGDYAQIYQMLEDLAFCKMRDHAREIWDAVALKANTPTAVEL